MISFTEAVSLAAKKHARQTDKAGEPYLGHLLRVADRLDDETARIVAVLHDILEDTDTTEDELRACGVDDEIIDAVRVLTHRKHVSNDDYLQAIAKHPLARRVKLADLADNSDPVRLARLPEETRTRLESKYRYAIEQLSKV